jgi:hypothetical protein
MLLLRLLCSWQTKVRGLGGLGHMTHKMTCREGWMVQDRSLCYALFC